METTPFFIVLFVHLSGLVLGFGSVLVTDLYGLLWVWNRVRFPQLMRVSGVIERFIWIGWGIMIVSGIPLIILKGLIDNLMTIKLFFVALIGLNGILLHQLHSQVEGYKEGEDVPKIIMFRLILSLFISQISWWCALLIGFLHRHVQSIIEYPSMPWLVCGLFVAALLSLWTGGELFLRAKNRTD